ncbi:MAG TPA: phosphoribosyltransferase family protein [Solirubrobacteraceae bacterium]|jgi:putative phosphoribosyl transferase|nr:phosphoribosyltransferase family protein [Solirubrobacteraceae bacterium]
MLRHFADRVDAGRRLAESLPPIEGDVVVLGLARGGVPVAAEVARSLGAPLDVLVVRKVGHPAQPEYALGAVSEDGVALPQDLPPELVAPQLERARRQAESLRRGRSRLVLGDRVVVVVDDGLATGRSMAAALETVSRHRPERVTMAVPVASGPGLRELQERWEAWAPMVVEPPEFFAVGQFYRDFAQVDDDKVAALLGSG